MLAIFAVILWLIVFPAMIGLLHAFGLWHGERAAPAIGAAILTLVLVVGLATRKPWRRPSGATLVDERPLFVRLSTWIVSAVLYPNVLMGAILLFRKGPPPDARSTIALGVLLASVQSLLGWLERRRRQRPS